MESLIILFPLTPLYTLFSNWFWVNILEWNKLFLMLWGTPRNPPKSPGWKPHKELFICLNFTSEHSLLSTFKPFRVNNTFIISKIQWQCIQQLSDFILNQRAGRTQLLIWQQKLFFYDFRHVLSINSIILVLITIICTLLFTTFNRLTHQISVKITQSLKQLWMSFSTPHLSILVTSGCCGC